jgi:hypothetical protein
MRKLIFAIAFFLATAHVPRATAGAPAEPASVLNCTEYESPDHATDIGTLKIQLDANGNAASISIQRSQFEKDAPLTAVLDRSNSIIQHEILPGDVTGRDEDGTVMYNWGISKIETIDAKSVAVHLHLRLHDHMYGGWPGSSGSYEVRGTTLDTESHSFDCAGPFRVPYRKWQAEDL